ncbi:hypothetical protein RGAI101_2380 [Roseobacter sp. GAI101]|nr:hypothetical protein RGAI101_2380 [Roseobacter sp. GAI101]
MLSVKKTSDSFAVFGKCHRWFEKHTHRCLILVENFCRTLW